MWDIITDVEIFDVKIMRRKLRLLVQSMEEGVTIQLSSSKLLNFFVNDILSLS
jgi:two-component system sensor histidine kinase/response regulator